MSSKFLRGFSLNSFAECNKSHPVPNKNWLLRVCSTLSFGNNVGKGEIANNEQFLLFAHCFSTRLRTFYYFHQILKLSSANSFTLKESNICRFGNGKSRLKKQLSNIIPCINYSDKESISKNCEDGEFTCNQNIPFSHNVFISFYPYSLFIYFNLLNPFPNKSCFFTCLLYKSFENTLGKGDIARNEQCLILPPVFSTL